MIDFVPIEHYYDVYLYLSLFLVLATGLHAFAVDLDDIKNIKFLRSAGLVLFVFVLCYIGLRPLSTRFGDMGAYLHYYNHYSYGGSIYATKDVFFHVYMKTLASVVPIEGFFFTTAFIYIYPMLKISMTFFKKYWFYAFLMFIVSFSFWTYGTNGIRNGMATSLFLWGLCYHRKILVMAGFFILASLFHKSLLLPILAFIVTIIYNKPKSFIAFWVLSIPMSLVLGSVWIALFTNLGFADERLTGYLTGEASAEQFSNTGFRWDFLIYGGVAVAVGAYFILKRNFNDVFYSRIYGTYLICNAFWILVIRANFSNRFAYLSWFMMAFIIAYPFLKSSYFIKERFVIIKVVTFYYLFTFFMYLLYY